MSSLSTYAVVGLISSVVPLLLIYLYVSPATDESNKTVYYPLVYVLINIILLMTVELFSPNMNMYVVGILIGLLLTSYDRFIYRLPQKLQLREPLLYQLVLIPLWSLWYGYGVPKLF